MKRGKILSTVIIVACIAAAGYLLRCSFRQSLTVKEVLASGGEPCEVYGEVVKGSAHADIRAAMLTFRLKDDKGDTIPVVYNKPKPATFDTASHAKPVAPYRNHLFDADQLILNCPSNYISN